MCWSLITKGEWEAERLSGEDNSQHTCGERRRLRVGTAHISWSLKPGCRATWTIKSPSAVGSRNEVGTGPMPRVYKSRGKRTRNKSLLLLIFYVLTKWVISFFWGCLRSGGTDTDRCIWTLDAGHRGGYWEQMWHPLWTWWRVGVKRICHSIISPVWRVDPILLSLICCLTCVWSSGSLFLLILLAIISF